MDSYANAPVSITEARSDRTGKSETWTVRDALVSMLREIDSGRIKPDHCIILWATRTDNTAEIHRSVAGPFSTLECLGMLTAETVRMKIDP